MEKNLKPDETGLVQEPHLHDSFLNGLMVGSRSASLLLRTPTNKFVAVEFHDLLGLSVETFFEQNIIFEIRIIPAKDAATEDFYRVLHLESSAKAESERCKILRAKELILVNVIPSIGADIMALCSKATWKVQE